MELLEMAGNGWKGLKSAGHGWNCWTWLEMDGMAGICWKGLAGNAWKQLEIAGLAGNGWKWLEMARMAERAGSDWK